MPAHRVGFDALEAAVADIEKSEDIVAAFAVGDGAAVVITKPRRGQGLPPKETR